MDLIPQIEPWFDEHEADAPALSVLFELVNSAVGLPSGLVWLLTGGSRGEARLLPNAATRISDDGLV